MRIKTLLEGVIIGALAIFSLYGCNRDETYIVSFDANGGRGSMPSQLFDAGVPKALVQNAYTREGYTFSGWNTMQAGNGTAYTNGQTITVTSDMTLYAQWTSNGTSGGGQSGSGTGSGTQGEEPHTSGNGILNGHNYVDLGLPSGTKWATSNVGANSPEEYGDYFFGGETTPRETWDDGWINYLWCNGWCDKLTKYCSNADYGNNGFVDTLTTLEASDDAATANWGDGWRMPTKAEMQELYDNCTNEWTTTQNGVNGYLFRGNNGNSIFLPCAGLIAPFNNDFRLAYWSSSLNTDNPIYAWHFTSISGLAINGRAYGLSVRPVCNQ